MISSTTTRSKNLKKKISLKSQQWMTKINKTIKTHKGNRHLKKMKMLDFHFSKKIQSKI